MLFESSNVMIYTVKREIKREKTNKKANTFVQPYDTYYNSFAFLEAVKDANNNWSTRLWRALNFFFFQVRRGVRPGNPKCGACELIFVSEKGIDCELKFLNLGFICLFLSGISYSTFQLKVLIQGFQLLGIAWREKHRARRSRTHEWVQVRL